MARYKATSKGNIPLTSEEEAARDAEELEWANGADDRASEKIRFKRDRLLSETDWMANSDVTMSDEWRTYRQSLRDISSQEGFPNDVTWPTKP